MYAYVGCPKFYAALCAAVKSMQLQRKTNSLATDSAGPVKMKNDTREQHASIFEQHLKNNKSVVAIVRKFRAKFVRNVYLTSQLIM